MTEQTTVGVAQAVAAAWSVVLGEAPQPGTRFLAAGGHSLAAARLIARLAGELGAEVPMSAILRDDPCFADLVALVSGQAGAEVAVEPEPAAAGAGDEPVRSAALPPTMRRIWTWHRLHPDSPAYNVVRVIELDGRVQPARLRAAMDDLAHRHEALRCAVLEPSPGDPEVVIGDPPVAPLSIEVVREEDMAAVDAALYRVADKPFPMESAPLWRIGLVWVPARQRTYLILVMHHLIADMRAADVMFADLAQAYRARLVGQPPQYAEPAPSLLSHVVHEQGLTGTPKWERDLTWWSRRLPTAATASPLPLARHRDDHGNVGRAHTVALPAEDSDVLDDALRAQGLTPAVFFLTVSSLVLGAWTGEDRAEVVGLPSVRMTRPQDERLVAFLLDTLMLPVSADRAQSLTQAYQAVRDAYADAVDHALPAYDDILDRLRLPRTPGTDSPLVRLWFNDMTQASPPEDFGGLPVAEYDLPPAWALFNLVLYLRRSPAGYRLHLVTPRGTADPQDMAALAGQILRTAGRAAADPGRRIGDLLEPDPEPVEPSAPPASDVESISAALRRHAGTAAGATAFSDSDGMLDYRTLNDLVNEHAAALPDAPAVVAVPARRDRNTVVRLLACWRAGATAVLVDAQWPEGRRARALEIAGATHAYPWSGDGPVNATGRIASTPTQAAHVLFTSGTTGEPLAVRTAACRADAAIADLVDRLPVGTGDRVAMLSGPAHDPVLRDIGLALLAGGQVCVPPPEAFTAPAVLHEWLLRERITVVNATPAMLALVFGAGTRALPDLRAVVCGGSPLSAATAALIKAAAPEALVVNGYGCTETPQLVVAYDIPAHAPAPDRGQVPIGTPLPGRRIALRAADGRRCDVGQLGEIWVAEPYIADGYTGDGLAGRFTIGSDGTRWLRTGDLARRDGRGRLHLAGRRDRQELVNGYRVMLEEIEAVARGCVGVTDALAQVIGDGGRQTIRVWVQRAPDATPAEAAVRAHLAAVLPPGVVPTRVVVVDRLDLSDNLKPVPPEHEPVAGRAAALPHERLRTLAEAMLGQPLDPARNFFDAGFTSASLLQFSAELTDVLGRPVEPLSMFTHPNLSALSAHLFGLPDAPEPARVPAPAPAAPAEGAPDPGGTDRLALIRADRRNLRSWIRQNVT